MNGKQEYGDYQTPPEFANRICTFLHGMENVRPGTVVEPTCGVGNFLESALVFGADHYVGVEINPVYCEACRRRIHDDRVSIIQADAFNFDFRKVIDNRGTLVIGNPPWVTNSALAAVDSANRPEKANFKNIRGIDAMTGGGNFDIAEYIILRLINTYSQTNAIIAMLCKTSVARNVFAEMKRTNQDFTSCEIYEFDARKVFGVSVSACLLLIRLAATAESPSECPIYSLDDPTNRQSTLIYAKGHLSNRTEAEAHDDSFDGTCCFQWRQGIKHDCSKIMELTRKDGRLINGLGQDVNIEDTYVFPLVKSSMFKKPVIDSFSRYVIVTQSKIRGDTSVIEQSAPLTWRYLNENKSLFDARRSSIYRGAPPFSMFGVGDYSYAPYKVGVSGFYKTPLFSLLHSPDGKPVMTDDTSYFICFNDYDTAYTAMLYLNSAPMRRFLMSIAFLDSKRPYTKKVLSRIDFASAVHRITLDELRNTEEQYSLPHRITSAMSAKFIEYVHTFLNPFTLID